MRAQLRPVQGGLTPYDFLAHVDHVLFEDYFFCISINFAEVCLTQLDLSQVFFSIFVPQLKWIFNLTQE